MSREIEGEFPRRCNRCGETKTIEFFLKKGLRDNKQRYEHICKPCYSLKREKYYSSDKYKEINRNKTMKYNKKTAHKVSARVASRIKISIDSCCKKCGGKNKLERHHPNYNNPLRVITLCRVCHLKLHYK